MANEPVDQALVLSVFLVKNPQRWQVSGPGQGLAGDSTDAIEKEIRLFHDFLLGMPRRG